MSLTEEIVHHIQSLPELLKAKVLDLVEYLGLKTKIIEEEMDSITVSCDERHGKKICTLYNRRFKETLLIIHPFQIPSDRPALVLCKLPGLYDEMRGDYGKP